MGVLVDSNVILDVATEDPTWGEWSAEALARAANRYRTYFPRLVLITP
jgi:hypothetical protein